jgi:hypothetical protein
MLLYEVYLGRTSGVRSAQATKTLMHWTNANEKTVKNWMAGSNGPRGEHLVALIKHSDYTLAACLRMAGRPNALVTAGLPL